MSQVLSHPVSKIKVMGGQPCSVDGCDTPRNARGWCKAHYMKWKRHGDPTVSKHGPPIPPPNPSGLCWCGCGQTTSISKSTDRKTGTKSGEHTRYLPNHHVRRGGIYFDSHYGRWYVTTPRNRSTAWARVVMEKHIGRPLRSEEVVHHINGQPDDDQIENLMLFPSNSAHITYEHATGQRSYESTRRPRKRRRRDDTMEDR